MSKENQIEEMAKVIEITEQIARDAHCGYPSPSMIATDLYNKGYRKQSEWIRVEDRLPDKGGKYLCYCKYRNGNGSIIDIVNFTLNLESIDEYDFENMNRAGWFLYDDEYGYYECTTVTHWMPLPETPKMKGGEG